MTGNNQDLALSVVVPAYNEERNIAGCVGELTDVLRARGIRHEVIVVNDCSTDSTPEVVRKMAEGDPNVRLVNRTAQRGFGRAIRAGLDHVRGDVVVIYMADHSDDPRDVVRYHDEMRNGYDCVFGSRFVRGSSVKKYPWNKLVVNRLVNKMLQVLFMTRFNDLTNAFKAYRASVIRECGPYRASHFNITIEMSLNAVIRNYNIVQVPISWQGRTWGSSNLHLKEMGRRYLSTLIKLFFEKALIRDDIIAESLNTRFNSNTGDAEYARKMTDLESRVAHMEEHLGRVAVAQDSGGEGVPLAARGEGAAAYARA